MNQTAHLGEILPCCDPIIRGSAYCWYVTVKPVESPNQISGRIDVPINDNGREQSHKAAELLRTCRLICR